MSARCSVTGVSKRYGRHWAVRDVTIHIEAGEIVGLVGPNGAGKTTLLRIMAGLLPPASGRVESSLESQHGIGYFAGERTLPPDIRVGQWRRIWDMPADSIARFTRIGALSRGMRQKLGLDTVFTSREAPDLLLLDEPWEGLDLDASQWLSVRLLAFRGSGGSAIVSSHRIYDLAGVCDRCIFMSLGAVVDEIVMPLGATTPDRSALLLDAFERTKAVKA